MNIKHAKVVQQKRATMRNKWQKNKKVQHKYRCTLVSSGSHSWPRLTGRRQENPPKRKKKEKKKTNTDDTQKTNKDIIRTTTKTQTHTQHGKQTLKQRTVTKTKLKKTRHKPTQNKHIIHTHQTNN